MTTPDTLRYTRIPLTHGSGAIPAVGFGTLIPDPLATKQATKIASEVGFRHLDCAERYRNEEAVGDAMQAAFTTRTIQREGVFVMPKLGNTNHRSERVKPAFDASRQRLQLDYVDCYPIHTPFDFRPADEQDPRGEHGQVVYDSGVTLVETWQALERLVDNGHCKSIGLSDVTLGTAFLTTSTKPDCIQENFEISTLPEDAMREIREDIKTNVRFNTVVGTGVPGFIPRAGAQ